MFRWHSFTRLLGLGRVEAVIILVDLVGCYRTQLGALLPVNFVGLAGGVLAGSTVSVRGGNFKHADCTWI